MINRKLGFDDIDDVTLAKYQSIQNRKKDRYKSLLGDNVSDSLKKSFYEVIVITAIDELQKAHYERMIEEKKSANLIPSFVEYYVMADPPGDKIGCGGSTLYVISQLNDILTPERFSKSKILLLHAGGYSKRLPNHSTSGKIFASIPFSLEENGVAMTMLEMKIITLVDFSVNMIPGIFLACADDIELFESKDIVLQSEGFTMLAHPGTVDLGLAHGVFVLENRENYTENVPNKCSRYLHKPTIEMMEKEKAKLPNGNVLMDSCFFFDHSMAQVLLKYYRENSPVQFEIDAYTDFLQPLGSNSKPDYFERSNNLTVYKSVVPIEREKLYYLLKDYNLFTIPLIPSTFIHIGTCQEYIEHFTSSFSKIGANNITYSYLDKSGASKFDLKKETCLIHCLLEKGQYNIESSSVVEYSRFNNVDFKLGSRCIIADLSLSPESHQIFVLPDLTFAQTLSIKGNQYVTVIFGIDDSLKATSNPTIFSKPLSNLIKSLGLTDKQIWENPESRSLWSASLFPVCSTPTESFIATYNLLFNPKVIDTNTTKLYSLEQCLVEKDLETQATNRFKLTESIASSKSK